LSGVRANVLHMDDYEISDQLFDADERPPATPGLPLDAQQRTALVAAVEAGLRREGCDNTLRSAQRWARSAGLHWPPLRSQLEDNGGFCDCEVLLNVLVEEPD
jgi:Protein of unknown function (DUF2695)